MLSVAATTVANEDKPSDTPGRPVERVLDPTQINLGFEDADEAVVTELAQRLGHHDYQQRAAGAKELAEMGPACFRVLSNVFAESTDYEVRLSIQKIVRDQYLWETVFKHNGFLGIQFNSTGFPVPVRNVPKPVLSVPVTAVVPGLPAEKAGLMAGDLIVAVDGVYLTNDEDRPDFPELITSKGAGTPIRFTVMRGQLELELEATLAARPVRNYDQPEMAEQLRSQLQAFSLWWNEHFARGEKQRDRSPSTVIFNAPD